MGARSTALVAFEEVNTTTIVAFGLQNCSKRLAALVQLMWMCVRTVSTVHRLCYTLKSHLGWSLAPKYVVRSIQCAAEMLNTLFLWHFLYYHIFDKIYWCACLLADFHPSLPCSGNPIEMQAFIYERQSFVKRNETERNGNLAKLDARPNQTEPNQTNNNVKAGFSRVWSAVCLCP